MQLKTILNRVQKFKSFVYGDVRWEEGDGERVLGSSKFGHGEIAGRSVRDATGGDRGTTRWSRGCLSSCRCEASPCFSGTRCGVWIVADAA
jgi:hypothetical protein